MGGAQLSVGPLDDDQRERRPPLRSLLVGSTALLGVLAIAWLGGTFWIRARETVLTSALPPAFPGRVIQVDGYGVRILERGEGPAVLLVAGTGGSVANWPATFLDQLSADHHIIAVDLYGMGFSARDDDFTMASRCGASSSRRC